MITLMNYGFMNVRVTFWAQNPKNPICQHFQPFIYNICVNKVKGFLSRAYKVFNNFANLSFIYATSKKVCIIHRNRLFRSFS